MNFVLEAKNLKSDANIKLMNKNQQDPPKDTNCSMIMYIIALSHSYNFMHLTIQNSN